MTNNNLINILIITLHENAIVLIIIAVSSNLNRKMCHYLLSRASV